MVKTFQIYPVNIPVVKCMIVHNFIYCTGDWSPMMVSDRATCAHNVRLRALLIYNCSILAFVALRGEPPNYMCLQEHAILFTMVHFIKWV